jgi:hypothetical protein
MSPKQVGENMTISTVQTGIWRHYAGEYYLVIGTVQHTERDEVLVLYVPLTGNERRAGLRMRARPIGGIKGFFTPEVVGGATVDRFEFIGNEMPGANGEVVG